MNNYPNLDELMSLNPDQFANQQMRKLRAIWHNTRNRCRINPHYAEVEVCDEWEDFDQFADDVVHSGKFDPFAIEQSISRHLDIGNYEINNITFTPKRDNNFDYSTFIRAAHNPRHLTVDGNYKVVKLEVAA